MDVIAQFKENAKRGWATFAPTEIFTGTVAPRLLEFAGVQPGQRLLDVGCGTGVVALNAARLGAHATGVDLTPELLARAREHAAIMGVDIDWHEGDVEALQFGDAQFDVVVSQFGHMFAPRPALAIQEMLRVLKPGGTLAFTTWPPELITGQVFALVARYAPPPPGVASPTLWGEPQIIRERLADLVSELHFDRDCKYFPTLSPQHNRRFMEVNIGPVARLVQALSGVDEQKLAAFRQELEALITLYFDGGRVRQDFLLTRARKR